MFANLPACTEKDLEGPPKVPDINCGTAVTTTRVIDCQVHSKISKERFKSLYYIYVPESETNGIPQLFSL